MNEATAAKAQQVMTSALRSFMREHGAELGARAFIREANIRGGRSAASYACAIVASAMLEDGVSPDAVRKMADFAVEVAK